PLFRSTYTGATSRGRRIEVLDENHLVATLVVKQLVDARPHRHQPESAGAQAHLLADAHVLDGCALAVADRRVRQVLEVESRAWIGDAIHQQPRRAQTGDADLPVGIELAAPLHRVQ